MATTVLTPTGAQIVDDGDNNWNQLSLAQGLQIFNGFFTTGPALKVANGGTGTTTGSITAPGAWTVAASGDMTLTPTGGDIILNGLVGINDSSPGAQLDITPTNTSTIGLSVDHPASSTADAFRVLVNSTKMFVVTKDGYVGVGGTSAPTIPFEVKVADDGYAHITTQGGVGESSYLYFQGSRGAVGYSASAASANISGQNELGVLGLGNSAVSIGLTGGTSIRVKQNDDNVDIYTGNTHAVTIDEFQQLGIGTSSPTARLHVVAATDETVWFQNTGTAISSISQLMYGLQLSAETMNTTSKYTPAVKFMSTDPQFTTENPKLLAFINGEATEAYSADTSGGMRLNFATTPNSPGTTNIPVIRMYLDQDGGMVVGAATGGSKGAGSINIAGDIEKNDSAYTNPDYVFEHWRTGKIERFANSEGAAEYPGVRSLRDVKSFVQEHWHFPHISRASMGAFSRGDKILELMEESFIHHFSHDERLTALEAQMQALIKRNR